MSAETPLIDGHSLTKSFGATKVLQNVAFCLAPREVHALLGGNGAGKSTLIRIITGDVQSDSGALRLTSARGTEDAPVVSVVHQELALLSELSVVENIGLVHFPHGGGVYRNSVARRIAYDSLAMLDRGLAARILDRPAHELSLHEGQVVELARALSTGAEILLLDEPTANLTASETEKLFDLLRLLVDEQGIGIVFVSHRTKEIRRLCDVCTILRDGRTVMNRRPLDTLSDTDIVSAMGQPTGASATETPARRHVETAPLAYLRGPADIPLTPGRILGLAGAPAGPEGVIHALNGSKEGAQWWLDGAGWPKRFASPAKAVHYGVGFVSGDRAGKGLLSQLPIIDNVLAARRVRNSRVLVTRSERSECAQLIQTLSLRAASIWDKPGVLSGGNQQKLILARWLDLDLRMIIFEEPTRGVDIGTKRDIYRLIRDMAAAGTIIVWWSTENTELLELCDEVFAFDTDGRPAGFLPLDGFSEEGLSGLTGMAA